MLLFIVYSPFYILVKELPNFESLFCTPFFFPSQVLVHNLYRYMEKLSRALCFSQDSSSEKTCKKTKEIMISETTEESLHNWKLPPFSASDIYEGTGIFNSSPIKTVEQEIPLSEGFATFPLFPDDLKRVYSKKFDFLHVGMIQVGLKPTKLGSNASAIICLRDKTHLKFDRSVLGMVESSLCDGPIYFSYFPPDHKESWFDVDVQSPDVSLSDDLSSSFSIDIKTEGSTTILMYRLHYRVLNHRSEPRTRDLDIYRVDKKGITTLFLTNFAKTNHAWPKKICWDEVAVPERWVDWKETAEARVLTVDVPADFTKEEVKVEIEGGSIVRISGERNEEQEEKENKGHRVERSSGKFLRRFRLPENVKVEEVKAVVENGVVTVTVPNEEVNKKLEVKVVHSSG